MTYRDIVIRIIARSQPVRMTKREENHSRWRKIKRTTKVTPTVTEKTILMNSFQKTRVDLSEYRPSRAKISKKNGATRIATLRYDSKGKSNRTGFISIMLGVKRNQKARTEAAIIMMKSTGTSSIAKNSSDFFMKISTNYEYASLYEYTNYE